MARSEVAVEIEGRKLTLSNLGKVFYPATGFTKGEVVDYYIRVAPVLLPHLRDRPLTLKRYPNGVDGPFFYEKRCPSHRPDWVHTEAVWSPGNEDVIDFCVVNELATLVWAANLADLELHTYLHVAPEVLRPQMLVFDLDPGPPADAVQCCEVALAVRATFDRLGLRCFPKTSGSKGVQVYVPLHGAVGYPETKAFARAMAEGLEAARPDLVVSSMKKALRVGKVLVDWSQNDVSKTTVCVYSLRAKERPTVSTPLHWHEVEEAFAERDARRLAFETKDVLARVERWGDLFAPVLELRQELPPVGALALPGAPAPAAKRPPKERARSRTTRARSKAPRPPARPRTPRTGAHAADGDGYVSPD